MQTKTQNTQQGASLQIGAHNAAQTDLKIDDWLGADVPQEAVAMMKEDAVVPFGTALWPI